MKLELLLHKQGLVATGVATTLNAKTVPSLRKESQKIFTCLFSCDATISWTGELFSAGAA